MCSENLKICFTFSYLCNLSVFFRVMPLLLNGGGGEVESFLPRMLDAFLRSEYIILYPHADRFIYNVHTHRRCIGD